AARRAPRLRAERQGGSWSCCASLRAATTSMSIWVPSAGWGNHPSAPMTLSRSVTENALMGRLLQALPGHYLWDESPDWAQREATLVPECTAWVIAHIGYEPL